MDASTLQISCSINTTDASAHLGLEIRLDNHLILDIEHVTELTRFEYNLNDSNAADHCLEFTMKNKTDKDTIINEAENIIKDACLTISDLAFDEIKLEQIFVEQAIYTHNFNGTQPTTHEKFYGNMGCNGTVKLKFTSPVYLWLLENM